MTKTPLNNLSGLRLLETLCDLEQLAAAADHLGISISAASRQLNDLRAALNDPLFIRNGVGLVPTARMRAIRPKVQEILAGIQSLTGTDAFSPEKASGTFRILSYDNALRLYIFPILPVIREKAPHLTVSIGFLANTEQMLDELRDGTADLAILPRPPKRTDMRALDLPSQSYQLLMRRDHPLARPDAPEISARTLKPFTQVIPGLRTERPWRDLLADGVPSVVVPFFNTTPFLALETDFVVWMPTPAAALWMKLGRFAVRDLPKALQCIFTPKLIWNNRPESDPLHQWVRSLIAAVRPGKEEADEKLARTR